MENQGYDIVYIAGEGGPAPQDDPFVRELEETYTGNGIGTGALIVEDGMSAADVAGRVSRQLKVSAADGRSVVVVVNVFLDPEREGVHPEQPWDPNIAELGAYLEVSSATEGTQCLKSLQVVWDLWPAVRNRAKILVTTDGVRLTRRSRLAIAHAFGDGRISFLYGWGDTGLDRLAESLC